MAGGVWVVHSPLIAGLGALGAWLLVAGPVFQAATELRDQGLTQQRVFPGEVGRPRHVSPWWWLLPPVAYWKHHRERERLKWRVLEVLAPEDVQRMLAFSNTALSWLLVAAGALCIAVKETWEFVEVLGWAQGWTWLLVVVAGLVAVGNAALQTARTSHILEAATRAGGSGTS